MSAPPSVQNFKLCAGNRDKKQLPEQNFNLYGTNCKLITSNRRTSGNFAQNRQTIFIYLRTSGVFAHFAG